MIVLGGILFVVLGLIMGMIGGGGSILGVPVMVYVLGIPAAMATAYSLFVIGIASLVGSFTNLKKGNVSLEAIVQFAIPSVLSIFITRKFIMPRIPELINVFGLSIHKDVLIMVAFALLMLISSWSMIKKTGNSARKDTMWNEFSKGPMRLPFVILMGILVGFLSGFLGAGGGFMIVPVLLFFIRIPIKKAIGTSLTIISINSLVGFTGNFGELTIDWSYLVLLSGLSIAGILIGIYLSRFVATKKLKPAFGWFTLSVGLFVIVKELILKN